MPISNANITLIALTLALQAIAIPWLLTAAEKLFLAGVSTFLIIRYRIVQVNTDMDAENRNFSPKCIAIAVLWVSTATSFASALAMIRSASRFELLTSSLPHDIDVTLEGALQVLQWLIVRSSILFALCTATTRRHDRVNEHIFLINGMNPGTSLKYWLVWITLIQMRSIIRFLLICINRDRYRNTLVSSYTFFSIVQLSRWLHALQPLRLDTKKHEPLKSIKH